MPIEAIVGGAVVIAAIVGLALGRDRDQQEQERKNAEDRSLPR